jgi:hypothetical protein
MAFDSIDQEFISRRNKVVEGNTLDFLNKKIEEERKASSEPPQGSAQVPQAQSSAQGATNDSSATNGSPKPRMDPFAAHSAKILSGAVKGATLGAVDIGAGTVGVPFTDIKHKFAPTLTDTLKSLGVDPKLAEATLPDTVGEVIGSVMPFQKLTAVYGAIARSLTTGKSLAPIGIRTGSTFLSKALDSSIKAASVGGASATIDAAHTGAMDPSERLQSAGQAFVLGAAVDVGLRHVAAPILSTAINGIGRATGYAARAQIFLRSVKTLADEFYNNGFAKNTGEAYEKAWRVASESVQAKGGLASIRLGGAKGWAKANRDISTVQQNMRETRSPGTPRDVTPEPEFTKGSGNANVTEPNFVKEGLNARPPESLNPAQIETINRARSPRPLPYGFRSVAQATESLQNENFAIITATNPQTVATVNYEGRDANEVLVQELISRGYGDLIPVKGREENDYVESFLVRGISPDETLEILARYGQRAAMVRGGILYDDKTFQATKAIKFGPEAEASLYNTEIRNSDGARLVFSMEIDEARVPHPEIGVGASGYPEETPEGDIMLERYMKRGDVTEIDPIDVSSRTNIAGAETRRMQNYGSEMDGGVFIPRANAYVAGTKAEDAVGQLPFKATIRVPARSIYDFSKDPEGFLSAAEEKDPSGPGKMTYAERMVRDAGYLGYRIPTHPQMPNAVVLVSKIPVEKVEPTQPLAQEDLVAAIRTPTGEVVVGLPGENHGDIFNSLDEGAQAMGGDLESGFVRRGSDEFLTREEVSKSLGLGDKWDASVENLNPQVAELSARIEQLKQKISDVTGLPPEEVETIAGEINQHFSEQMKIVEGLANDASFPSVADRLDEAAKAAQQRVTQRVQGKVMDVTEAAVQGVGSIRDYGIIGAALLGKGVKNLKKEILSRFKGDPEVKKNIDKIVKKSTSLYENQLEATNQQFGKMIGTLVDIVKQSEINPKWYNHAFPVALKFFGNEADAVKFWVINAGLSPQNEVGANMRQGWEVFRAYKRGEAEGVSGVEEARAAIHNLAMVPSHDQRDSAINALELIDKNPTRANVIALAKEQKLFGKKSPKVHDYIQALMGETNVVVVDTHMVDAFGLKGIAKSGQSAGQEIQLGLTDPRRDIIKAWVTLEGKELGITPVEAQAALWTAEKIYKAISGAVAQGSTVEEAVAAGANVRGTIDTIDKVFEDFARSVKDQLSREQPNLNWESLDERGFGHLGFVTLLARTLIGASIGGTEGETVEERIQNALIYGAGAAVAPAVIRQGSKAIAKALSSFGQNKRIKDLMQSSGLADDVMRVFDPVGMRKPAIPSPGAKPAAMKPKPSKGQSAKVFTGQAPGAPVPTDEQLGKAPGQANGEVPTYQGVDLGSALPPPPNPTVNPTAVPKGTHEMLTPEQVQQFKEADPTIIDLGTKGMKVHWDEIGSQDDIENILKRMTQVNSENIDKARRGVMSMPKTKELARKMGVDFDQIMARRQGEALNAEESQAYIDFLGASLKETSRLIDELTTNPGNADLEDRFVHSLNIVKGVHESVMGARAEAGRALNVWRTTAQGYLDLSSQVVTSMNTMTPQNATFVNSMRRVTPTRLALTLKLTLPSPKDLSKFVDKTTRPGGGDMFFEVMYGGFLLSNPATLQVNLLGNAITTALAIPERFLAAGVGGASRVLEAAGVVPHQIDHVGARELAAFSYGMFNSMSHALDIAGHAFKTGERTTGGRKIEMTNEDAVTAENLNLTGPLGHVADFVGAAIRTPLRGLMATDEFFKVINSYSQLYGNAYRQAEAQGLEGDDFAKSVVDRFREMPPEDIEAAKQFGDYQTFTKQLGAAGQFGNLMINSLPLKYRIPVKLALPFYTVPINLFKFAAERTPLAFVHQSFINDIKRGGGHRDLAIGKLMTGTALIMTGAYLYLQGKINGKESLDPAEKFIEKSAKVQEYSILASDGTQIGFDRLDPYGMILGFGADWAKIMYGKNDLDLTGRLFLAAVLPIAWNLTSKHYLEGAARLMKAVSSQKLDELQQFFKRQSSMVVPGFMRQLNKTGLMNEKYVRESRNVWDNIIAQTPGYSDSIPPQTDIYGYPVTLPGGLGPDVISGIAVSKRRNERHYKELVDSKIGAMPVGEWIEGNEIASMTLEEPDPNDGVELSPQETYRYRVLVGHEAKIGGMTFEGAIQKLIDTKHWKEGNNFVRQVLFNGTYTQYKKVGRAMLMRENESLRDRVKMRMLSKKNQIIEKRQGAR